MLEKTKWDALIDQKGKVQEDIYRAEQALKEGVENAGGAAKAPPPDPEKLRILADAQARLAAIEETLKAEIAGQVE